MTSNSASKSTRIASLDQFRGYCVAAMFIVNFLGGLTVTHHVLKHNNTHFSYADSIMPSFIFACGFSYRLSFMKRLRDIGAAGTRWTIVWRSFGLMLLSAMLTAFNSKIENWSSLTSEQASRFVQELIKANLWEVLAIIGAVQILLLPLVAKGVWTRVISFFLMGIVHVAISWAFNYEFVYGRPNWMDDYLGAAGKRAWDGGCFGLISWAQIMLLGTLAYDMVHRQRTHPSARWLVGLGLAMMLLGYGLSCLTRLYDIKLATESNEIAPTAVLDSNQDPVVPPWINAQGRPWLTLLAEPPLVPPPPPEQRMLNYWMMDKRVVTQSFVIFSGGMAMLVLGLFRSWCDVHHKKLQLFETFGKNPLAAYIIHHFVAVAILAVVPKDSPLLWALIGLIAFFSITWLFVRTLERRELYLRL
jgi:predicted acyltransferase